MSAASSVAWRKVMKGDAAVAAARAALEALDGWTTPAIEQALRAMLTHESLSARKGFQPIGVAITGSNISPPCSRAWPLFRGMLPSPGSSQPWSVLAGQTVDPARTVAVRSL